MKTTVTSLILALGLTIPLLSYADAPMPAAGDAPQAMEEHHGMHDPMHMMGKILNLTPDQEKQLKDLWKTQHEAMKTTMESLKSNREAFEAEIVKANADMSKVSDLENQLKTLQGQMVDNHLNDLLAVKKVLTPEQFAGYMALKKEHQLKRRHMMMHGKFGPHQGWGKGNDDHKSWGNHEGQNDQD